VILRLSLETAKEIAESDGSGYSLEEIRAAGERMLDAMTEAGELLDRRRRQVQRLVELERRSVIVESCPDAHDLAIWDLDDSDDPTGEFRLVLRAMSPRPRGRWTPRQIADRLDELGHPLSVPRLRRILLAMRESEVLANPAWGEYMLATKHGPGGSALARPNIGMTGPAPN